MTSTPIKQLRPALCMAAAFTTLFVAAPAFAKNGEPEAPEAEKPAAPVAAAPCAERELSKVFQAFHDRRLYTLAPDGDFEAGGEGWELSDGATVVEESSSIQLGDALGARSLELADGASATTADICVAKGFPSFRFVTRAAGEDRSAVRVEVLYRNGSKTKKAGKIKARADWRVSRKVSLAQGRFRVKRGQSANVRLRFTAVGGPVRVDDVYVDPRLRR